MIAREGMKVIRNLATVGGLIVIVFGMAKMVRDAHVTWAQVGLLTEDLTLLLFLVVWLLQTANHAWSEKRLSWRWPLLLLPVMAWGHLRNPHTQMTVAMVADTLALIGFIIWRSERSRRSVKTCPRCQEEVEAAARVCRFCGHPFPTPSVAAPAGAGRLPSPPVP